MTKIQPLTWQPLEMIPVFAQITHEMAELAETQLRHLQQAEKNPAMLEKITLKRMLKSCMEQRELLPLYLEQCNRWRKESLNNRQQSWLAKIEFSIKLLQDVNQKIFIIARSSQNHVI